MEQHLNGMSQRQVAARHPSSHRMLGTDQACPQCHQGMPLQEATGVCQLPEERLRTGDGREQGGGAI